MPKAEEHIVIDASIEQVFAVITDYERYPEFVSNTERVQVVERKDGRAKVSFGLQLGMRVEYTLMMEEDAPKSLRWSLDRSKLMSTNEGSWDLEAIDATRTKAVYTLEVELKGLIPKSVSTRLAGTTLPDMLEQFKARAESAARAA